MTSTLNVTDTRTKVLKILKGNPALSYSILASEFGVSRERIRQIARQNGYPPRRGVRKPNKCPLCGKIYYTKNQFCSRTCVYKSREKRIAVICHRCGKTVERTPGNLRSKNGRYFCNRTCFSKYQEKNSSNNKV